MLSEEQKIYEEYKNKVCGIRNVEEIFQISFAAFSVIKQKDRDCAEGEKLLPVEIKRNQIQKRDHGEKPPFLGRQVIKEHGDQKGIDPIVEL